LQVDINVGRDLLPELLSGPNGLAKLGEAMLNQILEAQIAETLAAERHEHSDEWQGYRNGYRPRTCWSAHPASASSHQLQERLNEEGRRRKRVIRIFPNDASALRLIGALLAEQNEVWQEQYG
jgi:transposase-like protein